MAEQKASGKGPVGQESVSVDEMAQMFFGEFEKLQRRIQQGIEVLTSPIELAVGQTPHEVVYSEDKLKLYHYTPTTKETSPIPVLVVYALVNKQYMMDLQPDRSMVRRLLDQGIDVYMIDWGYPSKMDRFLTLNDYINGYLNNCVDFVRERTGSEKLTLMGVCQGGTFSTIYSALYPEKVKNLVTVVTPIDFDTDAGLLNIWAREMDIDRLVDTLGNAPGDFMNIGYLMLNPFRLMFAKYVDFMEHMDDPNFVSNFIRMEKWIFDSPDQAGEALREFVKNFYQKNLLIQNKFELAGRRVDLRNITMPVLNIFAQYDHLVPPASSKPLLDAIGSKDKEEMCFPSGHIGIFVSSKSQEQLCPNLAKWLTARSGGRPAAQRDKKQAIVPQKKNNGNKRQQAKGSSGKRA